MGKLEYFSRRNGAFNYHTFDQKITDYITSNLHDHTRYREGNLTNKQFYLPSVVDGEKIDFHTIIERGTEGKLRLFVRDSDTMKGIMVFKLHDTAYASFYMRYFGLTAFRWDEFDCTFKREWLEAVMVAVNLKTVHQILEDRHYEKYKRLKLQNNWQGHFLRFYDWDGLPVPLMVILGVLLFPVVVIAWIIESRLRPRTIYLQTVDVIINHEMNFTYETMARDFNDEQAQVLIDELLFHYNGNLFYHVLGDSKIAHQVEKFEENMNDPKFRAFVKSNEGLC